jgi:hypothetical protein
MADWIQAMTLHYNIVVQGETLVSAFMWHRSLYRKKTLNQIKYEMLMSLDYTGKA